MNKKSDFIFGMLGTLLWGLIMFIWWVMAGMPDLSLLLGL